jgi:hypothetical protein
MLQHERVQEQTAAPAAKVAVSAEELAEALSALESRRDKSVPAGSITLGEAVSELSLSYTPEELLAEVQARRAQTAVPRRKQWMATRWLMAAALTGSVFFNLIFFIAAARNGGGAWSPPQAPATAAMENLSPVGTADHQKLVRSLDGQNFDAGRMSFLKAAFRTRSFTSEEVQAILKTFDFDDLRADAAVLLYPRVSDKDRFIWSLDAFQFDAGREAVLRRLRLN